LEVFILFFSVFEGGACVHLCYGAAPQWPCPSLPKLQVLIIRPIAKHRSALPSRRYLTSCCIYNGRCIQWKNRAVYVRPICRRHA